MWKLIPKPEIQLETTSSSVTCWLLSGILIQCLYCCLTDESTSVSFEVQDGNVYIVAW